MQALLSLAEGSRKGGLGQENVVCVNQEMNNNKKCYKR